jgi:hypothetical protein
MLYEQNVDVVLSAHEHLYERFAPMSPDGQRDDVRGIRQFIVGTGGAGLYTVMRAHPQSEVRIVLHGILKLTLAQAGYSWEFLQPNGTRSDVGSGVCH